MEFEFVHEFEASPGLFWEIFFDADYNVDMFHRLDMKEYRVLDWRRDGDTIHRKQLLLPRRQVPAPVRKVIGGDFGYEETNVWNRERSAMDVVIVPTLMADRFDMHGVFAVKPAGEGRCRRSFKGTMKVRFALLGGQIEKYIHADMKDSYDRSAAITREWIERWKKEGKTQGTPPKAS